MKTIKSIFALILLISASVIVSCKQDIEFDKLSSKTTLEPSIALPLFYADIELSDLLKEDPDKVVYNDDKSIDIIFRQDSIFGIDLAEYFNMPSFSQKEVKDIQIGNFKLDDQFFEESINPSGLGIPSQYEGFLPYFPSFSILQKEVVTSSTIPNIENATFESGTLKLTLTNNFPTAIAEGMKVRLHNANGNYFVEFTFPQIPAGETKIAESDMAGKKITNSLDIVLEDFTLEAASNITIDPDQSNIALRFDATGMKIQEGTIKFDEQVIPGTTEKISLGKEDQELYYIKMKSGILNVQLYSEIRTDCDLRLSFPKVTDKRGAVKDTTFRIVFDPVTGNARDVNIDFSDCEIDLTDDEKIHSTFVVAYDIVVLAAESAVSFNANSDIRVTLDLKNPEFQEAEVYLGQIDKTFPDGSLNTHNDFLDFIDGGLTLVDPRINFILENSFGVPAEIKIDLNGHNVLGEKEELTLAKPFKVTAATRDNPIINEVLSINKDNSNIVRFIDLSPEKIYYSASILANPDGKTVNYISRDSKIKVGMELKLPLEIKTQNLFYIDTVEIDMADAFPDFIEDADVEMYFRTENEFPLNLEVVLSPFKTDDVLGNIYFDDIVTTILNAPKVDSNGRTIAPKVSRNTLKLSTTDIENLKQATNMLIRVSMKTSEDGTVPVKLYSDNSLKLKVGVKIDAKIEN